MRTRLAITFFALAAFLMNPTTAFAHATVVSSNPTAGGLTSFMPDRIQITFTEDLLQLEGKQVNSMSLSYMKHSDLGLAVPLTDVKVEGSTLSAAVPPGQHETGNYNVSYSIVAADGHKLNGSFLFTLKSFGSTLQSATSSAAPVPTDEDGTGVLPLPIVGAIAIALRVGLFVAFGRRNRAK